MRIANLNRLSQPLSAPGAGYSNPRAAQAASRLPHARTRIMRVRARQHTLLVLSVLTDTAPCGDAQNARAIQRVCENQSPGCVSTSLQLLLRAKGTGASWYPLP